MTVFPWLSPPAPDAAVDISAERVAVATVGTHSGRSVLTALATEALPAGTVTPSLVATNIANPGVVTAALERCFERVGTRPRRVALVLPDLCAKVSLVRFDAIPTKRADLDQLIRWQIRKGSPFPIEDAVVSYAPGVSSPDSGHEYLVVSARRQVVAEYERVCESVRAHAGLVDLSTLSLVNFLLAGGAAAGDTLVVHAGAGSSAMVILRSGHPIFFRNRSEGDGELLADLVHQTAMYYQDRLGGQGFARVLLAGEGRDEADLAAVQRELEGRLGGSVERLDPRRVVAVADRVHGTAGAAAVIAPLCGILLRDAGDRQVA